MQSMMNHSAPCRRKVASVVVVDAGERVPGLFNELFHRDGPDLVAGHYHPAGPTGRVGQLRTCLANLGAGWPNLSYFFLFFNLFTHVEF